MAVARAKLAPQPLLQSREEFRRAYQSLVDGVDVEVSGYNEVSVEDTVVVEAMQPELPAHEDEVSVTDAVQVNFGVTFVKADTVATTDVAVVLLGLFRGDTAGTTDNVTVETAYVPPQMTINDTVSISEAVLVERLDTEAFNDAASTADSFSVVMSGGRRFDETVLAADAVSAQGSASSPLVRLLSPAQGSTTVAPDEPIVIELSNGLGVPLSAGNIRVTVNTVQVWDAAVSAAGWTGHYVEVTSGTFVLTLYPTQGFAYGQRVDIQVDISYGAQSPVVDTLATTDAILVEVNP